MGVGKKIGVDLDGTLCEKTTYDSEGFRTALPRIENIGMVNKLAIEGNIIIIWTGRNENYRKITEDWLNEHRVIHHSLVMDKMHFDIYIDEKRKLMPVDDSMEIKIGVGREIMECEECKKGVHRHLDGIDFRDWDTMPFYEQMELMDCKVVFYDSDGNSTGQCMCHLRTEKYNEHFRKK